MLKKRRERIVDRSCNGSMLISNKTRGFSISISEDDFLKEGHA